MKYCFKCGKELPDQAKFCVDCGTAQTGAAGNNVIEVLSSRIKTNAIIWLVIGCVQLLSAYYGYYGIAVVGILNIVYSITDFKLSSDVRSNPHGLVSRFKPLVGSIIALIYNLIIGGVVGVIGSLYYLIFVRGYVMENKSLFLEFDNKDVNNHDSFEGSKSEEMTQVVEISRKEAENGIEKCVFVKSLNKAIKIKIPPSVAEGSLFKIKGTTVVIKIHIV